MLSLRLTLRSNYFCYKTITTVVRNMSQQTTCLDYDSAIDALNKLQSNAKYINDAAKLNQAYNKPKERKFSENTLIRSGISLDKLDKLSVIHVAGTKGKGTTCAITEEILRLHGYKTGFYSSPHLLAVRERIRINGKPMKKSEFAKHFWKLYNSLNSEKNGNDMPTYFRFLTIMAFSVFLEYKVDVAIVEVGIGGEYDCTNILRKVPVVGITSLGIDHTVLLGNTIESIAWHKAGIMKKNCKAFTVSQPTEAMKVLKERSIEKECTLQVVDDVPHIKFTQNTYYPIKIFNINASLAVALAEAWLASGKTDDIKIETVNVSTICLEMGGKVKRLLSQQHIQNALCNYKWLGRYQVVQVKNITYYLDGAHTVESLNICANWYQNNTNHSTNRKVLIFNLTGPRNSEELLKVLRPCNFNVVLFVTNTTNVLNKDNVDYKSCQFERCESHKKLWHQFDQINGTRTELVEAYYTILDAIESLNPNVNYDILITGSLHLIGAALQLLDPDLSGTLSNS